ncbi:MAG: GNAT family N-acetyltransferase [Desulfobacteraceae bacterium]|nr:GNAT family N-acetyltransferase [Desulfobacteraceae bacterium]
MEKDFVENMRAFNRFYTQKIGLITTRFLESNYSLVQARILFELNQNPNLCAKDLVKNLGLDPAYLSKTLKKFKSDGLLTKKCSDTDSRMQILSLTKEGKNVYADLKKISNNQISSLVQDLSFEEKRKITASMETIKTILDRRKKEADCYLIRTHQPGDIGYVIHRHGILYAQEYGFNDQFDGYVAAGMADFIKKCKPSKERLWIAELNGTMVGSVAVVQKEKGIAQLRWLIVEPSERGKGLGKKLVDQTIQFTKQCGYTKIVLWTIDFLGAARKLYANAGFKLAETKESNVWGKILLEEKWELRL